MSDFAALEPSIVAEDVWVRFLIRYHRAEVTLRETVLRMLDPRRSGNGQTPWRQTFWALQGIDMIAHPGDMIGIVGRNGSGKSTFLKALAGICGADRGSVRVRGRVGCLLSFGVGFNANLSGRENVFLNGSILGLNRRVIAERLEQIIEFSELGDFIDAPVRTYSSGMRGRLGFAIAVHIDPDVLLLDEVLTVGDAAFREKTGSILERFRNDNKTVVIASHSMEMIRESCNKAIWLDQGRIKMAGDPVEVTEAYVAASKKAPSRVRVVG